MQSVQVIFGSHEKMPDMHDIVDSRMDQNRVINMLLLCIFDALLLLLMRYCVEAPFSVLRRPHLDCLL